MIVNQAGTYIVSMLDDMGCLFLDSVDVTFDDNLTVELPNALTICEGEQIELSVVDIYESYLWSNGETSANTILSTAGNYSVSVIDAQGCSGVGETNLSLMSSPELSLPTSISFCEGESVNFIAPIGFTSYQWSNGILSPDVEFSQAATYTLSVSNEEGCISTEEIEVTQNETIVFDAGEDEILTCSQGVVLTAAEISNTNSSFIWSGPAITLDNQQDNILNIDTFYRQ
jgi:hypothetical protein